AVAGPITVLINNAGVPSGSFFVKTSEEEWRDVMAVNLDGVFRVGREAARSLTRSMALELARERIRGNAIAPGYFSTEINADFLESEAGRRLLSRVPMGRAGNLAELDGPLLLLASDAGAFMTGSIITVDGGH